MRHDDPVPDLKRATGAALASLLAHGNVDNAAYMIGTDRSRIAELRRGKLDRFSLETLIRYLARMGKQVELRISDPPRAQRARPAVPAKRPSGEAM